jgi:hypothetical protein
MGKNDTLEYLSKCLDVLAQPDVSMAIPTILDQFTNIHAKVDHFIQKEEEESDSEEEEHYDHLLNKGVLLERKDPKKQMLAEQKARRQSRTSTVLKPIIETAVRELSDWDLIMKEVKQVLITFFE